MYYDLRFPYRISAEAGVAQDGEGNDEEAYIQVKIGNAKKAVTSEEYDVMHEEQRQAVAGMLHIKPEWVTKITGEEYEVNTDDEEE